MTLLAQTSPLEPLCWAVPPSSRLDVLVRIIYYHYIIYFQIINSFCFHLIYSVYHSSSPT